jgi:hypothetical protein
MKIEGKVRAIAWGSAILCVTRAITFDDVYRGVAVTAFLAVGVAFAARAIGRHPKKDPTWGWLIWSLLNAIALGESLLGTGWKVPGGLANTVGAGASLAFAFAGYILERQDAVSAATRSTHPG